MGNMGGMEGAPIEAKMPPMFALGMKPSAAKRPSPFGKLQMRPAPKTKKAKPTTGSFGKASMANSSMVNQIIPTIKTLHQEIMAQLSEIKGLIAQGGIATTTANLQGAQPQPPMAEMTEMAGGRRRRGTKRRGRGRA
jgi:hypothetical protein